MKRLLLGVTFLGAAAILGGCPIYSGSSVGGDGNGGGGSSGGSFTVCDNASCYDCPDPFYSQACVPLSCSYSSDCSDGYECEDGTCVAGSQSTNDASAGDCSKEGCPSGYICRVANGTASCVVFPGGGYDASSPDSSSFTDSGVSTSEGGDAAPAPQPCNADGDCSTQGARCIDGQCTAQGNLCSDTTQCVVAGEACVDGVCEPHCSASTPCPAGYACDFTRGVCDLNSPSTPCTGSGASSCQGGTVCVEGHCAAPCASTEGGAACPTGQVCINGGCIPDQAASFDCQNDGQSGQLANTCGANSVCLHHDCYEECSLDAGGCPAGQVCKNVTVNAGTFAVCGTASDLGSECDPATGKLCSGSAICIDGSCH